MEDFRIRKLKYIEVPRKRTYLPDGSGRYAINEEETFTLYDAEDHVLMSSQTGDRTLCIDTSPNGRYMVLLRDQYQAGLRSQRKIFRVDTATKKVIPHWIRNNLISDNLTITDSGDIVASITNSIVCFRYTEDGVEEKVVKIIDKITEGDVRILSFACLGSKMVFVGGVLGFGVFAYLLHLDTLDSYDNKSEEKIGELEEESPDDFNRSRTMVQFATPSVVIIRSRRQIHVINLDTREKSTQKTTNGFLASFISPDGKLVFSNEYTDNYEQVGSIAVRSLIRSDTYLAQEKLLVKVVYTSKKYHIDKTDVEGGEEIKTKFLDFRPEFPHVKLWVLEKNNLSELGEMKYITSNGKYIEMDSRDLRKNGHLIFDPPLPHPVLTMDILPKGSWIRLMSDCSIESSRSWPKSLIKINPDDPSEGISRTMTVFSQMTIPLLAWLGREEGEENYQVALESYVNRMANLLAVEVGLY